jgi:ERF superfamily
MPSESGTPELNAALAKVQENLPDVAKNQTGEVKGTTKDGKPYSYDYKYADLDAITDAIMPLLGKNGLAYTCEPGADTQDRLVLDYALLHESGQERARQFPLWMVLPQRFTAQTVGGLITYFRRYCLCAVTGVAPGGDMDAAGAEEAREVHLDRARPQARPPSDVPATAAPVRARTTGAGHEQLRHGTVEWTPDDKPTEHGPLPGDENPWQDVPPEDQPGSGKGTREVRDIQIAYTKGLGFDRGDRAQIIGISEQIIGRPLDRGPNEGKTHNNLSFNEARKLRDTLEAFGGDRGALMERLTGITQAVAAAGAQDAEEGGQE